MPYIHTKLVQHWLAVFAGFLEEEIADIAALGPGLDELAEKILGSVSRVSGGDPVLCNTFPKCLECFPRKRG